MKYADFLHRENNNLDLIRLICATLVIIGHTGAFIAGFHLYDIFAKIFPFGYMGAISVYVFFFISGLLITNSLLTNNNWKTYLCSRFFRIWPGLLVCLLITTSMCFAAYNGSSFTEYWSNAWHYVLNALTMNLKFSINGVYFSTNEVEKYATSINGSIWSIPKEVTLYITLLATWFVYVTFGKSKYMITLICILFILSPILFPIYGSTSASQKWLISLFFSGALVAVYKDKITINWMLPLGLFILYKTFHNLPFLHFVALMSIVSFFIWVASTKLIRSIKLKHDISYGVYIYGWPVQQLLHFFCPNLNVYVYIILSVLISYIIGYFSAIYIEEPAIKLSQNINNRIKKYSNINL